VLSSGKKAVRSAGGNTGTKGEGTIPAYPFGKSVSADWVESSSVAIVLFLKTKGNIMYVFISQTKCQPSATEQLMALSILPQTI